MMQRLSIATTLSMVLAACTAHGTNDSGAMEGHLAEAEEELDRHHGVVMDSTSLPDVIEEAGMHDSKMGRVMERMDHAMGGMMSHCSAAGTDEMHDAMAAMRSEMHDHAGALENAADLRSAHALCESHFGEMSEMFSGMQRGLARASCRMMRY